MNWDQIEGGWKQFGSQVKAKWAKLTDDDIKQLSARKDDLSGKLQERYGIVKEAAEREIDQWLATLTPPAPADETKKRRDSPGD